MLWSGWGDPAKAAPLPETVTALLRDLLGVKPRGAAPVALAQLTVPEPPLTAAAHRALAAA
ncbi:FAD-binding oxidoreductase, partial [Streptomyces sp. SID10815]|nr:FAD-binding oxidoreductase [Streptomyces sp. SID10815]